MTYEPKQTNKAPDMLIVASFICAGICFAFSNFEFVYGRSILQALSLVFFCVMIFVLVKFKFTKVRYTIRQKEDSEESADITSLPPSALEMCIERAQGTRGYVAECLIALEDITDFCEVPRDKAEKKALRNKYAKNPKFRYYKNFVGGRGYLIEIRTKDGVASVEIETEGAFANYLASVCEYNKNSIHSED